jgi:hypothetical protein
MPVVNRMSHAWCGRERERERDFCTFATEGNSSLLLNAMKQYLGADVVTTWYHMPVAMYKK